MDLRKHQQAALQAIGTALKAGHNPAVQMATGTGKSLVIADLASNANYDVWVLTHSQELVKQNAETYFRYTGAQAGIICAGLNRFDYDHGVIFGTIQSVINPALRGEIRKPTLIVIDEAHRVNHKTGEQGMYGRIFERYPLARRIAMTATAWRMDDGLIYGPDPEKFWFDTCCFKYTVAQGVSDGWLSPLVGVETEVQLDLEGVTVGDDFNNTEVGDRETNDWLKGCALSLNTLAAKRQHVAVYCPTVVSAMRAAAMVHQVTGWSTGVLTGSMSRTERHDVLKSFTSGGLRVLCSVETLTTGWDMPELDCLVCLRPMQSSSLWVQILGRGTRKHASKKNCLILDYVGNLQRLGGVDMLETFVRERNGEASEPIEALPAPKREPRRVLPGVRTLAVIDPTSGEQARDGATLMVQVHSVNAVAIPTRRDPTQPVLLVQYACTTREGARIDASAFITTERSNDAAEDFFAQRELAVRLPSEARKLMWQMKGAAQPKFLTVRKSGKYWNMIHEHWSEV